MALHYNIKELIAQTNEEEYDLKDQILTYRSELISRIEKIEKAIKKKNYEKVIKHTDKSTKILFSLGMEEAIDWNKEMKDWALKQGKKSEINEIFSAFKKSVNRAIKELSRDYKV